MEGRAAKAFLNAVSFGDRRLYAVTNPFAARITAHIFSSGNRQATMSFALAPVESDKVSKPEWLKQAWTLIKAAGE